MVVTLLTGDGVPHSTGLAVNAVRHAIGSDSSQAGTDAAKGRSMSARVSLALAPLLLIGCYSDPFDSETNASAADLDALRSSVAEDVFDAASDEYGVPADLLAAVAWHTSSFAPGDHDHDEHSPAHGWMGLRPDQVEAAAALTGLPADDVAADREANIFGAAALMAELSTTTGTWASRTEADHTWWATLVAWNDYESEWMNHEFAMDVFRTLQRGLHVPTVNGDEVVIPARELPGLAYVRFVQGPRAESGLFHGGTIDYPGAARFVPAHSSNQSSRSGGTSAIRRVVIHTVEGSYNGAISWFQNPSANVSAHYVVRKSDGEVTQQVRDSRKAWHACNNNNDTIGIEHEGAASNAGTWTPEILDSSARLTAWLVTQYNIPIDRTHIVGHGEIQGSGCAYRYDPGPHFPWTQYLQMVTNFANGSVDGSAPPDAEVPDTPTLPEGPAPASVTFQSPTNGSTVGNPVIMRVANTGVDHMEVWAGPYLLAHHLTANPVNVGYRFDTIGTRSITARGYSNAGALLAADTISITVENVPGTLTPSATKVSGATYRMTATTPGAAYMKYWVDGWPLRDVDTGSRRAPAPSYALDYTFNWLGPNRLLQVRAYDGNDQLLGEGLAYIDVDGTAGGGGLIQIDGYEVSGQVIRLTTEATPGVAEVEYVWNGAVLADMATGATRGVPDEFEIYYDFPVSGAQPIVVRAFNAAGTLVDTETVTIVVPASAVDVTWTRSAWHQYKFDGVAPPGTYKLVIEIDGWALRDQNTNHQYTLGPDFILDYRFNYGGTRTLVATGYDPVGNVTGTFETTIEVY